MLQSSPAIDVEEHDNTYGTRKVSIFGATGTGNLVRANFGGFNLNVYDYLTLTQASTTDTYNFYVGGSGGTLVNTLVITYTDSTKATIANVAKTL